MSGGRRNTPTYVGTTAQAGTHTTAPKEHPHVCGDNDMVKANLTAAIGTPPRMWGQQVFFGNFQRVSRNTPTYVGTTSYTYTTATAGEEHPHVCGDNDRPGGAASGRAGTPPRMWGQLALVQVPAGTK